MNRAALLAIVAAFFGCAGSPSTRTSPAVVASATFTEEWEYDGHAGKLIRTPSYRLFTTESDPELVAQTPAFLEAALDRYTSAFGPLPRPSLRLDTFLMADRDQWQRLTRQVMGPEAATYLRIDRGGFSSAGRALLWTIGRRDTLALIAHEGWHQFTQRTFRQELPAWLEEGVAVYMEGILTEGGAPQFLSWANVERFEQLRHAADRGSLLPLDRLLASTPQDQIAGGLEGTLTYYAQLWALIHFLDEGEGTRHRAGVAQALSDAAAGRLDSTAGARLTLKAAPTATDVFKAYFGPDLDAMDSEFRKFTATIVARGTAETIGHGISPLANP